MRLPLLPDISWPMKLFYLVILSAIIMAAAGCRRSANTQFLDSVEAGIALNPDSALSVLEDIDTAILKSDADKARYHLLMAESRYKADFADTLMTHVGPAVDYYKDHGPRHDAARAYFYSALVKSNRRQFPSAVVDLLRAEKIAKADNDTMRLALIYRSIGDAFLSIRNRKNALSYHIKAQKYFEAVKADIYSYNAYYDMARCYLALSNYPAAIKYATKAYLYGKDTNDIYLMKYSLMLIGSSYWYLNEYARAYKTYMEIYDLGEELMISNDFFMLGKLYLHFGDMDKAREMQEKIASLNPDDKELYTDIMILDKNYPEAIKGLYHSIDLQNKTMSESWATGIAAEVIKFEQREEQIIALAHKKERLLWGCIILLVAVAFSLIIVLIARKNKILTMRRDADMEAMSRLNDTIMELASKKDTADMEHASEVNGLKNEVADARTTIRHLMMAQFQDFSDLCQTYFQHEGHKNFQAKIHEKVKEFMSRLNSNTKFMATLEVRINASLNDLMKNFREDFPNLNNWEYPLFIYNVCGIEPKIVALFLGLKPELIHKRKANLKRKIAASSSPLKDEYLSFLS